MGRKVQREFDQRRLTDIVRKPLVNEKATMLMEQRKYTFEVTNDANKYEVRAAIEFLFDVKVTKVNTHNLPPRARRIGRFPGKRPQYKRAIVTLAPGYEINLFPEV